MKRMVLAAVLIAVVLLPGAQVRGQDGGELQCSDADIAAAIDQAVLDLDAARQLQGPAALEALAHIQVELGTLDHGCRHIAEAAGTPSDPLPIGEYYEFEGGLVRVMSVAPVEGEVYGTDGYEFYAVTLEYLCQIADVNQSCEGLDFILSDVITADGVVLDTGIVIARDVESFSGEEAFSGNTLSGVSVYEVPPGTQVATLRFFDTFSYDEVYVDVSGGAG